MIAAAFALLLLTGPPPGRTPERPTAADLAACARTGGTLQPAGLSGYMAGGFCTHTYRDAGKTCTDGSDCQSRRCALEGEPPTGRPAVGRCRATNYPFGCQALVIKGKAETALCTD